MMRTKRVIAPLSHLTLAGQAWVWAIIGQVQRALKALEAELGRDFVSDSYATWRHRSEVQGFGLRVARAAFTVDEMQVSGTPAWLADSAWVALVANAVEETRESPGAQQVIKRLVGANGDDAAFEMLVGAYLMRSCGLGPANLHFVQPRQDQRTADLLVHSQKDDQLLAVECKRRDDKSEAEERRDRVTKEVIDEVRKAVARLGKPLSVGVFATRPTDDPTPRKAIRRLLRDILQRVADTRIILPGQERRFEETDHSRGVVVWAETVMDLRPGQLPPAKIGAPMPADGAFMQFGHTPNSCGNSVPYAVTIRLGPAPAPQGADRRVREAVRQLPDDVPGMVAVWLRERNDDERETVLQRLQRMLSPGNNTRVSAILGTWVDIAPVLKSDPNLRDCLHVRLLQHPQPRHPIAWLTPNEQRG